MSIFDDDGQAGDGHRRKQSTGASPAARAVLGTVATSDSMRALCVPSTVRGLTDLGGDVALICGAVAAAVLAGGPLPLVLAGLYIGFVQRRLANLVHELAHGKLVAAPRLNAVLGRMVAAALMVSFTDYRGDHSVHHAMLGTEVDPKLTSYRRRGAVQPRRDVLQFLARVWLPAAGWHLPVTTAASWIRQPGTATERVERTGLLASLFAVGLASGHVVALLALWLLPLLVVRPAVNFLTDMINHVGVISATHPHQQVRGFDVNPVLRHLLAGHHDDAFHPIHHLLPKVVHHRLAEARALIEQATPQAAAQLVWCSGLFFRRRRTPNLPSVLEDMVTRLQQPDGQDLQDAA
jgi:fatty acid desaturase